MILRPYGILVDQFDGKGVEIQADTNAEVAAFASQGAAKMAGVGVLVEDAGLFVDALSGFPGPYSSYVLKTIGIDGIITLLAGEESRDARFVSSLAFCQPGSRPVLFEGVVDGRLARKPRGTMGFGFDPIFIPKGGTKTFGEIEMEEKCKISHRAAGLRKFAEWYLARPSV